MKERDTPDVPVFITRSEYQKFREPDRCLTRTLVATPLDSGPKSERREKLDFHVKLELRRIANSEGKSFSANCITVVDDDGMSWSAESVNAVVMTDFPQFNRWCLANSRATDSLPVISNLVGLNSFLGLAAKHRLTQSPFSFLTLRRGMVWVFVAISILLGTIVQALGIVQKMKFGTAQPIGALLSNWTFYTINGGLALLGLASQMVAARYSANPKSNAIAKLVDTLNDKDTLKRQNYDAFVEALAEELQQKAFPRAVIIDNFNTLDETTRRVILRYFETYSELARGSECWFIFQQAEGVRFSTHYLEHQTTHAFTRTQFFRQDLFDDEEKKQLINIAKRGEEALNFVTAKRIAHAQTPDAADIAAIFEKDRSDHPKRRVYGALDFLYLLSLTADTVSLTERFIARGLSEPSGLRPEVLRLFLSQTRITEKEFREKCEEIQRRFESMLIVSTEGDSARLRVVPERTAVLVDLADKLDLPDAKLGHLFWSLLWYDKLQQHPVEAIWMRKLSEHLLQADSSLIENQEARIAILFRLFDAALFTVNGLLKTCLFRKVPQLLQMAAELANGDLAKRGVERRLLQRLLASCWQAYAVLGAEEILRLILEIYDAMPQESIPELPPEQSLLESIFLESIPLAPDRRRGLKPDIFWRRSVPEAIREAMSDYACVCTAWLGLAASPHVPSDVAKFYRALVFGSAQLPSISQRAFLRIEAFSEESIPLASIATLSLSLWCRSLRFSPVALQTRFFARLGIKTKPAKDSPEESIDGEVGDLPIDVFTDLPALIAAAEDAVLLAADLDRGAKEQPGMPEGANYLLKGFAKELCAVALASVIMANRYSEGLLLSKEELKQLNDLIRISNDFLEYSLPTDNTPEDLLSHELAVKIESLMKLCGVIWSEFGLERLRDYMNIRRVHFWSVCEPHQPDDFPAYNSLVNSLGQLLNQPDFGGLMANLTISESLAAAQELKAFYLVHTADLAVAGNFGPNIRNQLCLAAVLAGHMYSYDLNSFLEQLVLERPDLPSLLNRFLKSLPEKSIEPIILKFMNASRRSDQNKASADARRLIGAFVETIGTPEVKSTVSALLEGLALEDKIHQAQNIDVAEILSNWANRRDLWLYPGILDTLFSNGYGSSELAQEALLLLKDRDAEQDNFNSYFLLSLALGQYLISHEVKGPDGAIATNYLRASVQKWKASSSADINLVAFQLLYEMDPAHRRDYIADIQQCQLVKIERDHLKRLPRLLEQGQLFLVFQYYFQVMQIWGLQADISFADLQKEINITLEEKGRRAREWQKAGGALPQPFIGRGINAKVSSKFLKLGAYLFSAPNLEKPIFDELRQSLNEASRSHISELFGMILTLPTLPVPLKDLIRSHSERLQKYTMPAE